MMPKITRENNFQPRILHLITMSQVRWFNKGIFRHRGLKKFTFLPPFLRKLLKSTNRKKMGDPEREFNSKERRRETPGW